MHKNENRPGYKNSKVGWIPEGWSDSTLGTLLEKHPCYGINAAAVEYSERLPTYLRITDISEDGYFLKQTKVSVNSENSADYMLDNGDLVFARTGASTGKTYLYDPNDGPLVFAGFLIRVRPNQNKLHPQFLKAFTSTYVYWNWISVTSMRSGQPGVNGNEFADMQFPLPPLPEQKAIAGVLECWDMGIRNLGLKIEKKRLIKKGLMQRLLSGKQRLKGFSKAWKSVRLGEVATVNEKSLGQNTKEDYKFYYIDLTCVNEGTITLPKTKIKFSNAPSRARRRFKRYDILMATVRPNLLGHCYVNFDADDKICSTGFAVVSARQGLLDNRFFYAHLFGEKLNTDIQNMLTGSSYPSINSTDVENLSFDLPPLAEQKAIADVLTASDSEIEALEKKLALWKELKKHLLNNLVTGTIRLPQFCVKA